MLNEPKNEKNVPNEILHNQKLDEENLKKKFYKIIEVAGIDKAISEIHREIGVLEPKVFDGGFDPARFKRVQYYRSLARDLYNYKLEQDSAVLKK